MDYNLKCVLITFERHILHVHKRAAALQSPVLAQHCSRHFSGSNRPINDSLNHMVFFGLHINLGAIRGHAVIKANQNRCQEPRTGLRSSGLEGFRRSNFPDN